MQHHIKIWHVDGQNGRSVTLYIKQKAAGGGTEKDYQQRIPIRSDDGVIDRQAQAGKPTMLGGLLDDSVDEDWPVVDRALDIKFCKTQILRAPRITNPDCPFDG